ncbi:NAD(P)/FAD-dependent oxidoreductase [Oleomonas cavernae]|uniref:NAD(P)/FAD-dependent oxidoreductase n=1 Tax=Oleomonas cavernae TaxID=2320859 RepID=A0A418WGV6_9PROT|nr:NAD(P)/FAD-dependent oxidoreductase [Oleomonas cavernae]RJF89210.1 NAD(P)/FAD-dependent oxidoreductase [Oleomonas cavernae]
MQIKSPTFTKPDYEVAIIGAGFAGIGAGIRMRQNKIDSFVILEKAADVGGTWRDNTYPGIAVDIPSFTYSFSFEPNPDWSRVFAPGAELKKYANDCTEKHELRQHMKFNAAVADAVFDAQNDLWRIRLESGEAISARFIINATGGLSLPKLPQITGIDTFRGKVIHTARWDHNYELRGKRVAIIGTGATSVQLVPAIAPLVDQLDVYQRTPIWVLPKPDREIPGWMRWAFKRLPLLQRSFRLGTTIYSEVVMVLALIYFERFPGIAGSAQKAALRHLERQVSDPEIRRKLTPSYGFGCKRPSFSNTYWASFNRENIELVTDAIGEITPRGIVTKDGRGRDVDVLICATGFKVFEKGNLPTYTIHGLGGLELGAFWEEQRYQAYEGATVPNFPNLFLVPGPYATSGSSWFSMIETQTAHALRCITQARRRNATYVEVRQEAHDRHFQMTLERQKHTVFFNNNCSSANSYYFDRHGDAPFLRPASSIEVWWKSTHFPLQDYVFSNPNNYATSRTGPKSPGDLKVSSATAD